MSDTNRIHANGLSVCFALLSTLGASPRILGQVHVAPQAADQLSAVVLETVTYDENTRLYDYAYSVSSDAASAQEIWFIAMEVDEEVVSGRSPEGWSFLYDESLGIVWWGATGRNPGDPEPTDYSTLLPSPFQIKPGESLSGFGFRSVGAPTAEDIFLQGFTPLPVAQSEDDFDDSGYQFKPFQQNSFIAVTLGPMSTEAYSGNRRPAVDGFLGFTNLSGDDRFSAPVSIGLRFSLAGESVDRSTFYASLNGTDVTRRFVADADFPGDLRAVFELAPGSPLVSGKNVLLTGVDGIVPGTSRSATDTDRVTFSVQ